MRSRAAFKVYLIIVNVCSFTKITTTSISTSTVAEMRRGRPPKSTIHTQYNTNTTTADRHPSNVSTVANRTTEGTAIFDYDGGTTWSESKFPRQPPRTIGPVFGPDWTPKEIEKKLRESKIIPDVLLKSPKNLVQVTYDKQRTVHMGTLYSCLQLEHPPVEVEWPCEKDSFYTLILTDPDSPTPDDPYQREFHHWIVGNIPGCHVRGGVTLSEYITPLPITYAGTHRYVFLVYKQDKGRMKFNWEHRDDRPIDALRGEFNSEQFAKNHSLSGPVAINFFTANWEMTVTPLPGDEAWLTTKDFFDDFEADVD
ncbi:OV-16 antigen [Bemisia tabaci]|uniref:OV-16 antigen n=1 Tax=Bemisia tabaci TaxID=7038 RepID=UPI003B27FD78